MKKNKLELFLLTILIVALLLAALTSCDRSSLLDGNTSEGDSDIEISSTSENINNDVIENKTDPESETESSSTAEENYFDNIPYSTGLAYIMNSDGASYTCTGVGECTDDIISVPPTHNSLPVTYVGEVGSGHGENWSGVTTLIIPDGVTVPIMSFYCNQSITTLVIGKNCLIDRQAFSKARY